MSDEQTISQQLSDGIKISERSAEVACPRCEVMMHFGDLAGTKVVVCAKCSGLMIQSEIFAALVRQLRKDYVGPTDQPRPISPNELEIVTKCPACWKKMDVHPYYGPGNIVIDSCPECHIVWLDGNELVRVIRGPGRR